MNHWNIITTSKTAGSKTNKFVSKISTRIIALEWTDFVVFARETFKDQL